MTGLQRKRIKIEVSAAFQRGAPTFTEEDGRVVAVQCHPDDERTVTLKLKNALAAIGAMNIRMEFPQ